MKDPVTAAILTIGDELLIGQVVDTNSAWLAQQLNTIGVWVKDRLSIGDDERQLTGALNHLRKSNRLIMITGGLGPTADDITKPVLTQYFNTRLVRHEPTLKHLAEIFEKLKRPMTERNARQADVPENCEVLHNAYGTAPGMWFEDDHNIFISMPGVPFEMKHMVEREVLPRLNAKLSLTPIIHRTLLTSGVGESSVADVVEPWASQLPANIKLAYLPGYGMVRLRLTLKGSEANVLEKEADRYFEELQRLVHPWLVSATDEPLEKSVIDLLQKKQLMMVTAESCTGGFIAHTITQHAGASKVFAGSIVSYTNALKTNLLQVETNLLKSHGAVSEPTVRAMLKGVLEKTGAHVGIAVSGIMGPDGGTPEKPVGMVWIAAGSASNAEVVERRFRFGRQRNIELTTAAALDLLRKFLLTNY